MGDDSLDLSFATGCWVMIQPKKREAAATHQLQIR